MTDDDIFREVEEDLRREQLKAYWDKFGLYIIIGAVSIIAIVAGYKGWTAWTENRAQDAGAQFEIARTMGENKKEDAAGIYLNLMKQGPKGYKILATLQLASSRVAEGKTKEAVTLFDQIANDSKNDAILREYAKILAAQLRLDTADHSEMKNRLESLTKSGSNWRYSASELLGLSAHKATKFDEALKYYNIILAGKSVPPSIRSRATMMVEQIKVDQKRAKAGTNLEDQ